MPKRNVAVTKPQYVHQMLGFCFISHSGIRTHTGDLRTGRTVAEVYSIGGKRTTAKILKMHSETTQRSNS